MHVASKYQTLKIYIDCAMNVVRKINSQEIALVELERQLFLSGGWEDDDQANLAQGLAYKITL